MPEDAFDQLAFVRRSAFDTNRKRKTVIIGENEDFRAFATLGRPDRKPPFSPREGGADKGLLQFSSENPFTRAATFAT